MHEFGVYAVVDAGCGARARQIQRAVQQIRAQLLAGCSAAAAEFALGVAERAFAGLFRFADSRVAFELEPMAEPA